MMLNIVSCAYGPFVCLIWRNVSSALLPVSVGLFVYLLLSYKRSLCILDTNSFLDT